MAPKKISKKRKGCLFVLLIFIGLFFMYSSALTKAEKKSRHRTYIATILKDGVEKYYLKYSRYPENVTSLDLPHQQTINDFLANRILSYTTDTSGKEWFAITCRFAGLLSSGDHNHSLSWSGVQYSNDIKKLPLWAGESPKPDENGFYPADFH